MGVVYLGGVVYMNGNGSEELTGGEQLELLSRYRHLNNEIKTLPDRQKKDIAKTLSQSYESKCGKKLCNLISDDDLYLMVSTLRLIARELKKGAKCNSSASDLEDLMIYVLRDIDSEENLTNYREETAKEMNSILNRLGLEGLVRKGTSCD